MAEMIELKEQEERVILVAVSTGEDDDTAASVDELEELGVYGGGRYGGKGDPEPGERPSRDVSGEGKDRRGEGAFMGAGRHRHYL